MYRLGDKGQEVQQIQRLLISAGYSCGPAGADGDFGKGTYDAVIRFQQEVGLEVDGIVGPATQNALSAVTGDGTGGLLKMGCNGASVKVLQNMLISKGYSCGSAGADGDFGQGTYDAVYKFQTEHNLTPDGVVGPATWAALKNSASNSLLKIGSKGVEVREAQSLLISKGYNCGSAGADGDFGQGTWNAVFSFQKDSGLTADGIIGPATWAALRNGTETQMLRMGSRGSSVSLLQSKLISLGYSCGPTGADGDFGQATHDAVCAFQASKGLAVDGIVGPATWAALGGNNVPSNQLLQLGSKGDLVRELQNILISLGYSCGPTGADGDFGQATYDAVCAFQHAKGLVADGIVGPATWSALNWHDASYVPVSGSAGVARFLEIARGEIGYAEVPINYTKYGRWYGCDGNAWCAMFVSWCANRAGILGSVIPSYCLCSNAVATYRRLGRYRTKASGYRPKEGDVFFLYDPNESVPYCHTGIVEYVDGNVLHTIEGNSSDMVRRCIRHLSDWNIDGYGDNGGIYTYADSDAKIFEQQSKEGFAKVFGIRIKSSNEIEIPIPFGVPGVTIKYKCSIDREGGTPDSKINGVIKVKNGEITTNISTPYSDTSKINNIKAIINSTVIKSTLLKLGDDCDIKIKLQLVNSSCIDITLCQTKKLSNGVSVTQSVEFIFRPMGGPKTVYETVNAVDWETVAVATTYVAVGVLVIAALVATGGSAALALAV